MALPGQRTEFDRRIADSLPAALRFAVRLTGELDAAEEVVQDAMVRASRSWRTYRGDSEFRTWLLRIVVNAHRDRLARRPAHEPLDCEPPDARQAAPLEAAAAGELAAAVAREIARLPLRQREALVLSAYEGLSPQAIARVLETNVANVYATLNVARSKLRKRLAPFLAER